MIGIALPALAALSACGGGGGGAVASTPPPPAAVTPPPPPPPPPPTTGFNTAEYQRSNGAVQAGALTAYNAGATGAGIIAAVVDSGVVPTNAEFAGKIHPASADLASNRGVGDQGGHGTAVSSVLLGAKNDTGTHGVAFGATLLVARTDNPGSCSDPDPDAGCAHDDNTIARGVDLATNNGARVINMSLGGSPPNNNLRAAIDRATAAGVIIVISAGNDFDTDPTNAVNPDLFAQVANETFARNLVIIAGALESNNTALTAFSNRAGNGQTHYIGALGRRVQAIDETGATFLFSGTSFSAPIVSGAVALLAQAFPTLTAAQIVDLLFRSADDLGAVGTDATFGRGALNIARAFQPVGQLSLAGSAIAVTEGVTGATSAAMGDASKTGATAVVLDDYGRAFDFSLGATLGTPTIAPRLAPALGIGTRSLIRDTGRAAVSLSVAQRGSEATVDRLLLSAHEEHSARALAGAMFTRLGRDTVAGFGISKGSASLIADIAGGGGASFLIGEGAGRTRGFDDRPELAFGLVQKLGRTSLTFTAESGEARLWENDPGETRRRQARGYRYSEMGVKLDRSLGRLALSGGLSLLAETETVLGGHFGSFIGSSNVRTVFADIGADLALGNGWSLAGAYRAGRTKVPAGGLRLSDDRLSSAAWSFDITKAGLFGRSDRLGLRLSQPLRIANGGFGLTVPVAYDYATLGVSYGNRLFNLAPTGREIVAEAVWSTRIGRGSVSTNLFWRRDPGNIAAAPDDAGVAVRYTLGL